MASGGLHLTPAFYDAVSRNDFVRSGQCPALTCSPTDGSLAIYATLAPGTLPGPSRAAEDRDEPLLHIVGLNKAPSSERRLFITDTSVIFVAFRKLLEDSAASAVPATDEEKQRKMNKLAQDYVNHIKECWVHASQPITRPEGPLQYSSDHYRSLYTCFSLFVLLYMPEPGFVDAPVGDELMEWLNVHFIEPSTEEGDQLSTLDRPWEDDNFWPYLTRTTVRGLTKASAFFLQIMARHPSSHVQHLSSRLAPLLESQPRLQHFSLERDYTAAARKWKDQVRILRLELDRVPEGARDDTFENWWNWMSDIVGILEGRADVLKRVCFELGADWKEVCAAWTVFINARIRRSDLPDIVAALVDEMPPDPTNMEDMVHVALFSGNPADAVAHAADMDVWLAAHLADVMEAVGLFKHNPENPRQNHILTYAEYLQLDPGLWRITVEYMCSCGVIGEERADEVIMRVPLRLDGRSQTSAGEETDDAVLAGYVVGVLKEINHACQAHGREEVRRMVCKIAAKTFIERGQYGLAVSYYTSAEDWSGLGHAVDCVLEEFVSKGPQTFVNLAVEIAPSLQLLRAHTGSNGVFVRRLMFTVRYAEFQQRMLDRELQDAALDLVSLFREEVAPKTWWGVLLTNAVELLQHGVMLFSSADAYELLFRLQEVETAAAHGAGDDYLAILIRIAGVKGETDGLSRLRPVRLALARYMARCAVIGVGGKDYRPPLAPRPLAAAV